MKVNSGGGRPWPVQVKLAEEPMLTEGLVGCRVIPVGGSACRQGIKIHCSYTRLYYTV